LVLHAHDQRKAHHKWTGSAPVVVLTTGETTTTGVLAVLADTSVTG
jgi:hypothetical protein